VRAELVVQDAAQLLVPSDRGLGVLAINECTARLEGEGRIAGEAVVLRGRGNLRASDRPGRGPARILEVIVFRERPYSFGELLRLSLWHMEREAPQAYASLCRQAPGSVSLRVDGELVQVCFGPGRAEVRSAALPAGVHAEITRAVILALADGELTLLEALLSERMHVRGAFQDLLRFEAAFMGYLNGAVRSPSLPALWRVYRGQA
jgi:hypothetical protein